MSRPADGARPGDILSFLTVAENTDFHAVSCLSAQYSGELIYLPFEELLRVLLALHASLFAVSGENIEFVVPCWTDYIIDYKGVA